jgi:hypothetical protein
MKSMGKGEVTLLQKGRVREGREREREKDMR